MTLLVLYTSYSEKSHVLVSSEKPSVDFIAKLKAMKIANYHARLYPDYPSLPPTPGWIIKQEKYQELKDKFAALGIPFTEKKSTRMTTKLPKKKKPVKSLLRVMSSTPTGLSLVKKVSKKAKGPKSGFLKDVDSSSSSSSESSSSSSSDLKDSSSLKSSSSSSSEFKRDSEILPKSENSKVSSKSRSSNSTSKEETSDSQSSSESSSDEKDSMDLSSE